MGSGRYLLPFVVKRASDYSNFTCIFTKKYPEIWQINGILRFNNSWI